MAGVSQTTQQASAQVQHDAAIDADEANEKINLTENFLFEQNVGVDKCVSYIGIAQYIRTLPVSMSFIDCQTVTKCD